MNTKAWTGYLVGYEGRHQYRIYDPARQAVFVRRDVIFDESSIGPKSDSQSIDTTPASDNKVTLGFPSFCFPYIPWLDDSPAILPPQPVTILSPSLPPPASPNLPLNSDTNKDDENIPSDSEDELSLPPPSSRQSPTPQTQRRSARLETKPTPNYYNRGRTSTAKTNSSVPLGSPHSKPSQALFQYALAHVPAQASQGFVRIARKGKRSTPDLPSLKEAMQSPEASEWKEAMQREYDALIENGTWKLVKRPTDQHVLTAKWAFKRKRDIDGNIKRYKARWVARGFEQREGVDYFETFAAVVKPQTNKVLFAMTAKKSSTLIKLT